jgi:hypothetical protein
MPEKPNLHEIYPDEVVDLIEDGVGVPDIYFGPLYRGNGNHDALDELDELVKEAKPSGGIANST